MSRRRNFNLTINLFSGRIGCAYYDPMQCKIFVLEDTEERAPYDLMTIRSVSPCRSLAYICAKDVCYLVLEQASPDIVLTSSRAEDDFIDVLRDHSRSSSDFLNGVISLKHFSGNGWWIIPDTTT